MTVREKIIEFLEQNDFQSIKQISKGIGIQENTIRTKIFDKKYGLITKGIVVKVAHKERKGFFSLRKNVVEPNNLENPLDKIIIKKMLKPFAENQIKVNLESKEVNRVKELWGELND